MTARTPAVAGMFYPADPAVLEASVHRFLESAAPGGTTDAPPPKALIVPHAGYQYSGAIAATAYRHLIPHADRYSRVVLLGPAHRVYVDGIAIPASDTFTFPGGEIALDTQSLREIASMPGVCVSDEAHAAEHCLEVQLPFLDAVLGPFTLVPFVVGRCPTPVLAAVLRKLWGGDETLVVVSSDLSHYLTYEQAVAIDRHTATAIAHGSTSLDGHEACGAYAINGLMTVAAETGLEVQTLDVRNSGDTAGDRSRVVGYGAFVLR